jgi:hypothetical protein
VIPLRKQHPSQEPKQNQRENEQVDRETRQMVNSCKNRKGPENKQRIQEKTSGTFEFQLEKSQNQACGSDQNQIEAH